LTELFKNFIDIFIPFIVWEVDTSDLMGESPTYAYIYPFRFLAYRKARTLRKKYNTDIYLGCRLIGSLSGGYHKLDV